MKQRFIHLFLLSGFLALILCGMREYILIREYKTWDEAQVYCRQNYIDLATVQTDEEWSELNTLLAELQFYMWIGLYDDATSWRWSLPDTYVTFLNWAFDQPNNLGGKQYCVILQSTGYWWDEDCYWTMPFFCQNSEGRPVLVTDPPMSWDEAQSYCRANFSDLFAVTNSDVNLQLTDMIHLHSGAWIGLSRDSWKWLNNTSPYSPLPWAAGQPDNSMGKDKCGALDDYGQIDDETCSTLNFFLCQTTRVKQQILRLEVKAGDNVNDRAITAHVLNKVQQSLRAQGIAADVKLTWRERPGEGIFQKTESTGAMMDPMLLLVLMSCAIYRVTGTLNPSKIFYFVNQPKAFDEAQRHCRDAHTDLATLRDRAEVDELLALEDFTSTASAWIGLKKTSQSQWQWSLADQDFYKDGKTGYIQWGRSEPTNTPGEYCSVMDDQGNVRDTTCQTQRNFICYNGQNSNEEKHILVNDLKSWREAQSYCRQFHTDLASVRNPEENLQIQKLIPATVVSYIGLYRDVFGWSDGDSSSFRNWDPYQPDGSGDCVAQRLQDPRLWVDETCSSPKPFFCYATVVFKQVLRLELGSDRDVNDPDVKATILQEIQQRLISQGVTESVQWRQQPDGNIFQARAQS